MKSGNNGKCDTCRIEEAASMGLCNKCWEELYINNTNEERK